MYTGLEQLEVKKIMTDFFHFLDDLTLLMYKYGINIYTFDTAITLNLSNMTFKKIIMLQTIIFQINSDHLNFLFIPVLLISSKICFQHCLLIIKNQITK